MNFAERLATLLWAALWHEPVWLAGSATFEGRCHWCRQLTDPGIWLTVLVLDGRIEDVRLHLSDRTVDDQLAQWAVLYGPSDHDDQVDAMRYATTTLVHRPTNLRISELNESGLPTGRVWSS